jgi:phosphate:Na+ symporter
MVKEMVFGLVGGLGLFLFAMGLMSEGLKGMAGQKLKSLLESLTKRRLVAVLIGALTTCLIQSSSATTVMTVGFVNAGLLSLKQALCVVLGANVGTTFTAWLVSTLGIGGMKITLYALPAIGLGFLLKIGVKKPKFRSFGQVLLALGLLFLGLDFMKDAFGPLSDSPRVQEFLISIGDNPLLAVLAGTVITMLLQSSSASIAMIQVLAFQGAFGTDWEVALRVAIPFILGDNIGTTITAQLAAIPTSRNSKRTAMGHTIFNTIGVLYMLPLVWLGVFDDMVRFVTPVGLSQSTIMLHLAVAHSTFNVFNTILFLPLIGVMEKVVLRILPVRPIERVQKPVVLERHLFNTPVIALEQARREIIRMAEGARDAVQLAVSGIMEGNGRALKKVMVEEDLLDEFQLEITSYLVALSQKQLSEEVSSRLPVLLHTVNDLERVGDHAVNIVEIARRKVEHGIVFSDSALAEAGQLKDEIAQMFGRVQRALEQNDKAAAESALANENHLNKMQLDFRRSHVKRMSNGKCTAETGLIFCDLVDNIEKIGDHLTNIAQAVIGGLQWAGVEPRIERTAEPEADGLVAGD